MERVTGGCLCGAKRFSATIEDDEAILCHYRMCQRWAGGVSVPYKNVKRADLRWEAQPDYYTSSPIARRGHCATCGTPLTFEFTGEDDGIDVTVGSFDDPGRFRPVCNYARESWHVAWLDVSQLPAMRSDENDDNAKRWMEACGKLPD